MPPTPSAAYDPRASSPPPTYFDKFTPMSRAVYRAALARLHDMAYHFSFYFRLAPYGKDTLR